MKTHKLIKYAIAATLILCPLLTCSAMEGDINGDEHVDLADAVLSLKVQVGQPAGGSLDPSADIDADGRIGPAEALYALRKTAGVGEPPDMDIQPASLYLSADQSQETVTIFNRAAGQMSWSIDGASLPSWITGIEPASGTLAGFGSAVVTITVDRTGLDPASLYTATIPVESDGGDMDIHLTLGFENGWSRSVGTGDDNTEYHSDSILQTSDGGYIFVFENIYGGAGNYDYGIAKLAADGSLQWAKDFGGSSIEAPKAVIQTPDGGYMVAGQSYSYRTGTRYCDIVVIKLDAAGGLVWQKNYGGDGYDISPEALAVGLDSQGNPDGVILGGATTSFGAGGRDIWLLRLEDNGDIRWQKTLGASGDEYARSIHPMAGGFWLAASTSSFGAGAGDVWIVKLDSDGAVLWERAYGGIGPDSPVGIVPTATGGCAVGAATGSFLPVDSFWAFEIDAGGALQWQYTYGGDADEDARDFRGTPDGGYIMCGWTDSFGETFAGSIYKDAWLIKLDAAGGIQWQKFYNKPFEYEGDIINAPDWAYSVAPAADGGYAVVGDTDWWSSGDTSRNGDVWIFKVNSMGELGCGIGADSTGVADDSGIVAITGPNAYTLADTAVVPGSPTGECFTITPEAFDHCGPGSGG